VIEMSRPEKKFKAGAVSATIWANQGQNAKGEETSYSTVSLDRSYKDKNNAWQHTSSMRLHDLPKAALVLTKAYEYLVLNEKEAAVAE
jgi:hypothetical protein